MILFEDKEVLEVIKAKDIRYLTGISEDDFQFLNEEDTSKALDELLENWIRRIASHIYVRIERKVNTEDEEFLAIKDVLIRTVANLVAIAQQQRASPVVQIDNFAVNILNTGEVTKELDKELEPFIAYKRRNKGGWSYVFSSIDDYEGDL